MQTVEQTLLPCPFCGSSAKAIEGGGLWFAQCASADCWAAYGEQYDRDAMHDHAFSERDAAITAWNTRFEASLAPSAPVDRDAAKMRAAELLRRTKEALSPGVVVAEPAVSWLLAEARFLAEAALALPPSGIAEMVREMWQPIDTAPRDGTIFIARIADHPSFGSWPMLRRVRHVHEGGEFRCIDLGAWLKVLSIEPDYHEGRDTSEGLAVPFSIAADDLNKSVRYEWQSFPAPPADLSNKGVG